jgi:ATP-dependent exoDNAse (exonuclease V) beta subunit
LDAVVAVLSLRQMSDESSSPGAQMGEPPVGRFQPLTNVLETFEPRGASDQTALDEFRRWFAPLQRRATRLSVWEVVSALFAETGYLEALARSPDADQQLANVRKLLAIAIARPELSAFEFADKIREIRKLRHREGLADALDEGADAVTLMTIHAAKGLEFDTVVIPDTLENRRRREDVAVHPRHGLVATRFGGSGSAFEMIDHEQGCLDSDELKRLLYVAMTRARRKLCLAAAKGSESLAGSIAMALGSQGGLSRNVYVRPLPEP